MNDDRHGLRQSNAWLCRFRGTGIKVSREQTGRDTEQCETRSELWRTKYCREDLTRTEDHSLKKFRSVNLRCLPVDTMRCVACPTPELRPSLRPEIFSLFTSHASLVGFFFSFFFFDSSTELTCLVRTETADSALCLGPCGPQCSANHQSRHMAREEEGVEEDEEEPGEEKNKKSPDDYQSAVARHLLENEACLRAYTDNSFCIVCVCLFFEVWCKPARLTTFLNWRHFGLH